MNKPALPLILLLLLISMFVMSCSTSHIGGTSKRCGCGMNKGMVGY